MVRIYISNVAGLPDPKENLWIMEGLPDERKNKILRYVQVKDRRQSLGASLLLKHVLNDFGMDISNISYGLHGKPELPNFYFNLSHSHDYVVCAVSDKPVGCDIESVGKARERIAEHFFTKNEVDYLNRFEGEARMNMFYRIWTMKESFLKMTGEGLAYGLKAVEIRFAANSISLYRNGEKCNCSIKEYDISGYKMSICVEGEYDLYNVGYSWVL